jgi:VWFA-related protein
MKAHRLLLPVLALTLAAQKSDPPLLHVTTRLVEVNVIVRDRNGPVRDLTRDDFTLFEKGKERKIATFEKNAATASVAVAATPAQAVFSNRPQGPAKPVNVTVVLLDGLNTDIKDQEFSKQQLLKFLRQIRPEDRVAVYTLGTKLRVLNDFSSDARRLAAAVARLSGDNLAFAAAADAGPADSPNGQGTDKIVIDAIENQANDLVSDYTVQMRAETTAAALEAIANHIAGIPGRKSLIWITASFPFSIGLIGDGQQNSEDTAFDNDISGVTASKTGRGAGSSTALYGVNDRDGDPARNQKSFTDEALRATRALNDANVAVYPVDARGLTVMPKSMTAEQNYGLSHSASMTPPRVASTIPTGTTAMRNVADATGGIVFQNGNDLQKAIRTAVDDGEVTYTLGFYPESSTLDSKFHELKVQVRRKDVEVRYRRGYLALPEAPLTAQARTVELRDALRSPLQAAGIGLTAKVVKTEKERSVRITVAIEPHDLALQPKDGKWSEELDLIFGQWSGDGRQLGVSTSPLGLALDQAHYEQVLQEGLSITKTVDLEAGASAVRIVVGDRTSGRIGSLILPMK